MFQRLDWNVLDDPWILLTYCWYTVLFLVFVVWPIVAWLGRMQRRKDLRGLLGSSFSKDRSFVQRRLGLAVSEDSGKFAVSQPRLNVLCDDDSAKSARFIRFIDGFDVGYSSDRRTLEGICRGRTLAVQFLNPEEARDIYEAATQAAPNQAYLYQQWAIFETTHPRGDVLQAERLAETAAVMEPGNNPFIHTQAEVARKRANVETSAVLKQQLRRQARMFLNKLPKNYRFTVSSRCKLMVDEIADLSDELRDDERGSDDSFFAEKLRDTESMLMQAQQAFPDDAEMFDVEARLWSEMKDKTKALRALERAWRKMPRGSGTAIRIGKIYATAGRRPDELKVLTEALDRNPEDKTAHYAMAVHLLGDDPINNASVIYHLGSSFETSDANFEARFTFALFLFATGDVDRAVDLFSDIDKRAPKEFRRFAPRVDNLITALLPTYRGTVESTRDNNIFIRSAAYPNRIFAHRSALDDEEADEMEVGQQVFFRLRFNRVGPVAVSVSLKTFIERRNAMTFESQTAVINREASRQTA